MAHLTSALTSVKGVNKTDCVTLISHFGVRWCFPLSQGFLSTFPLGLASRSSRCFANVECRKAVTEKT